MLNEWQPAADDVVSRCYREAMTNVEAMHPVNRAPRVSLQHQISRRRSVVKSFIIEFIETRHQAYTDQWRGTTHIGVSL